jgi:hypothetical protein
MKKRNMSRIPMKPRQSAQVTSKWITWYDLLLRSAPYKDITSFSLVSSTKHLLFVRSSIV